MAITINVNLDEILQALKDDLTFTGNADKYIKVNATADGFEFAAVSGGGTWGSITGTLSDQTDLQTALDAKVPYTGATTNVNLGEFGVNSGYLQFDLTPTNTPTSQGTAYWDDSAETVALIMNGTTQKVGEDTFYHVKNSTGVEIAKGTAVMFAGTDGASGKLLITPFLADGTYPSSYFMGITAEAIANGANGKVYHFGKMLNINTSVYQDGDILYASTTSAGGFQTTKPSAPNNVISVAAVVNAGNNGTLMIRSIIEDSPTLDDVTTAGNTTTNSISVGGATITSQSTSQVAAIIQAAAGQTANLLENRTSAAVVISGVQANGQLFSRGNGGSSNNFVIGDTAGRDLTSGNRNAFAGALAGRNNTYGSDNTYFGFTAGQNGTSPSHNVAVGNSALQANSTTSENTAIGQGALLNLTTGGNTTAVGRYAGAYRGAATLTLTSANESVYIGKFSRASDNGATNEIVIGYNALGSGSNTITLGNTSITDTYLRGTTRMQASTASRSGLRILSGVDPTAPVAGDLWFDGTNLKFYDGTTTHNIV